MLEDRKYSDIEPDLSYLNEIASGSVEFMIDMINVFLEQTPLYFEQLNEAVDQKSWKEAGEIAHKIKPTLAFMGVEDAKNAMAEIERKARSLKNVDTIKVELQDINLLCAHLYEKLEQHKQQLEAKL